jgi:hypothetical protein
MDKHKQLALWLKTTRLKRTMTYPKFELGICGLAAGIETTATIKVIKREREREREL